MTEPDDLDDNVLNKLDDLDSIIKYFEPESWSSVKNLIEAKKVLCTCRHCKQLIKPPSVYVQCDQCDCWLHLDCAGKVAQRKHEEDILENFRLLCKVCKKLK